MDQPTDNTRVTIKWTDVVTTEYEHTTTVGLLRAALVGSGRDVEDYLADGGTLDLDGLRAGPQAGDALSRVLADNIGPELAKETSTDCEREVTSVALGR